MFFSIGHRLAMTVVAVAFALGANVSCAQATKGVINAITITTYPPFESKDLTSNKLVGFDIDIVEALAAKMGAKVNWIESSFDQVISFSAIKTKRADIAVALLGDTPERQATVGFVDYVYDNSVFFTLKAQASNLRSIDSLCGKRVAVTRSSVVWPPAVEKLSAEHCAKAGKPSIIVVGTDGAPQSRLQLSQGRVDAAVQGAATLAYQNTLEGNRYVTIGKPFMKILMGAAFSKEDPQFGLALKKAFAETIADGTYQKLLQKWNIPEDGALSHAMINGQP